MQIDTILLDIEGICGKRRIHMITDYIQLQLFILFSSKHTAKCQISHR